VRRPRRLHATYATTGPVIEVVRADRLLPIVLLLAGALVGCAPVRHAVDATGGAAAPLGSSGGSTGGGSPASSGTPAARPRPFDTTAHSTTDPHSIWVVVNKTHPISPSSYRPEISLVRGYQVAGPAAGPLSRLLDAGDAAGLGLKIASAFRSYDYQRTVHDGLVAREGTEAADQISARPGFSEHQTGLVVDLVTPRDPGCDLEQCFARTPAGRWLAAHAWELGFIVRYTAGNQAVTGYAPEPWHLRYVGRPLAAAMRAAGVTTLEEFLHVPGGDYR
jgi:D-alanyl-D-alanine carboxypeptidase